MAAIAKRAQEESSHFRPEEMHMKCLGGNSSDLLIDIYIVIYSYYIVSFFTLGVLALLVMFMFEMLLLFLIRSNSACL